ncbi:MAG TPA: C25 family cysteine peptidase [Candidatus Acidoferrales bacterium]|nr:C25 family cysteine peptidase [Candidatus Acidoferrales bacterium]
MTDNGADSKLFEDIVRELLGQGLALRFQALGASMSPAVRNGDTVEITPVIVSKLRKDDIVLAKTNYGFRLHRIVLADHARDLFITRGDCGRQNDPVLAGAQILGIARSKEVRIGRNIVQARFRTVDGWFLRCAARAGYVARKSLQKILSRTMAFGLLAAVLFLTALGSAQVAVDGTSSAGTATDTTTGNHNLTIAHTTGTGANRIMLVGVSLNIANVNGAAVSNVTWNGTALTQVGAHNDTNTTRRVEMWYLLAPASGNHNVVVTVNLPAAGTVGVVAGVTTFTGADQTVPLGTFVSADGAAGTCTGLTTGCSALDVPSVINGMILDTLAIVGNQTVTIPGPQVSQWNTNNANNTNGIRGTASSRSGAPSVPISETFSGTSNWSLGAISINPSTADIAVSTSVSAVPLGQNSTYNVTITNNGPSAANNVTLTDTYASTGLSVVSVNPSAGTCTTGTTITCTLPTPMVSGATVTVAIVVSTTTAGFYPNTATIADSGTPPDPNTGNNTYVALAPVVSVVCSTTVLTAGGTLSGVVNTYYPGTATIAKGATSIPVGAANGSGTIAAGSELLVIQMQDASINTSNSVSYGNGSTGTGFTTINNAGNYEFVTATGPVSGGSVPITGAGPGGGLVFGYTAAAATGTKGRSTYQVVLVAEYLSATLGSVTAAGWNGSTGGILALDIAGQLNLGGATVAVDGLGFRGGAGMQLTGGVAGALNSDYVQTSPTAYTGAAGGVAGIDAPKGEGVAGTPEWVESGGTFLQTTTGIGYPNGTGDGSMARGAPGNAGAGGTDGDAAGNTENAGGGGGGNGGMGGFGGDSWDTNLSDGGEGGSAFPATIDRISMGGGGGAGTRNNSDGDNQASGGAAGGGIIFIRADSLTGTATLTANGASAYNGTSNDAGGGGGAGGTIVILSANGGESGLTLQANGGRGGDAWDSQAYSLADRHGPGGGGAGGVVFVSGTTAGIGVGGGNDGTTLTPGVAYGSTPGNSGTSSITATLSQVTGIQSSALCSSDLTLSKSHVGNFTRGNAASYTIPVSNVSTLGATAGVVTMNDTLPTGLTPTTATGTGWSCTVSGQTVSCTRSDSLAVGASYPSITLNATVLQTAPATVTNTAVIAGGGEANLLNDIATDVANVVSSADMSVTDSASPDPVTAGSNITYTQLVANGGPSAADNATIVETIPTNTTFISLTPPSGWSCVTPAVGATGTAVCTNVDMLGLSSGTFTMIVKVNSGVANGTVITDTVSVASSASDPNSSNNTATATTIVGTSGPNLSVTNVAAPNPVQAGNNITYTQVVTNTGSSAVTTATFTEATPANTTFVSITPPAGWTCTGFPGSPCTDPSVAAGSSGTFTVVYKVTAGTASGTVISDTATVNGANQSFGANSATATDVVASATQADLALSTTASPATVLAGNDITYTQTVTNNGPAAATGVTFTEATPTNTTYQSVSAPVGWTCTTPAVGATGTVTCTNPSLASGSAADIVVVVNVPATVTAASITAASSISATTSDPNSSNNSTSVTTPLSTYCDLTVTDSGTPSPVTAGSTITYTQTVYNHGPSNCASATLTEATPANTTFVSVAAVTSGGGTWTCPNIAPISCTNPSVPPGSTGTITAIYRVNAGTAAGTIITDTVTGASATRDSNSTDNSATVQIAVASGTQADLSVSNSATPNPVSAGNNITYAQTVTNAGPATANAPVFTETLPANTTAVSLTGPAGWTCVLASLTCTDTANMATGTANFSFVVTVNASVASGTVITQTDSVASTTADPNSGNNSATASTYVGSSADLSVANTPNPVPVQAGNTITYTQVVNNAGPSGATSVTLTDTLPANTTAQSLTGPAGWTCTLGTLTCVDPALAVSSPATITFVVKVNAGTAAGTAINETATVSSAISDPNSSNNTAIAADVVATATQADLVVTNSAAPASVSAGSNVTYTQTLTNNGPAAATSTSFTETTPPNTTFQSITIPAGWTCPTLPAVGGTGTITCNDGSNLATGAANTVTFTIALQVNSGTPSGTNITDTASATASNVVPSLTTNTASSTVVVANANSADMAIVKTGSPNPVLEGDPLTYSLTVTNNGPATATNVTVADLIPSSMIYQSYTTTQGACSEAGGTLTCALGTMANAATAMVTVLVIPQQPGQISNTATVSADQVDPNPANNTSTFVETVTAATAVTLRSFSAHTGTDKNGASRVVLTWATGGEVHNLGFNVYREQNGNLVRMNPSVIAGSALLMSGALPRHAARSYAWIDPSTAPGGTSYWLEDIDVNGTKTMHGPVNVTAASQITGNAPVSEARMLSQLNQAQPSPAGSDISHFVEAFPITSTRTTGQIEQQFALAAHPAVKIYVRREGWYSVGQAALLKAGLDPNVDPASLHLYAEAVQQPMKITGATPGPGGFGPQAAINFYGTGIDTVFSGTRVYWLVAGEGPGARVPVMARSSGSNQPPLNYPATVELQQHLIYFAALLTQNGQNFFGALISPTPVDQTLQIPNFDTASTQSAHLEVSLQGIITGFPHDVSVVLNGTPLGDVIFTGQDKGNLSIDIPTGVLLSGSNTVTLTAQNGDYDTSLVEYIRITYPHRYAADSDELKFTARAGDEVTVNGFTSAPTVVDITDPNRPVQLTPRLTSNNGAYAIAVQVPFLGAPAASLGKHTLLAVASDRIASPAGVWPNHPSHWHIIQRGADIAMVTHGEFASALAPLVRAHEALGKTSVVVPILDLYDEFNFGERSPFAVKRFLATAKKNWSRPPSYLLLNGRASFDPRNYLGFGNLDLVPTRIVPTASLMTSSDDWFSDFNNSGLPTIATGRLPVSTLDEANTVVSKIVAYEAQSTNGPWTVNAMMVADKDDTESFTQDTQTVEAALPSTVHVTNVFLDTVGTTAAQGDIISGINSGQLLVNYLGHGSEEQWSGSDIFDENSVPSLTNTSQLPVFLIMDCLNGFFQDVYAQPLAVTLLVAPNGGASAVVASSGLNQPAPQTALDTLVVQSAITTRGQTLGQSLMKAKASITDLDVRRTYILFGDPAMQVKQPGSTPSSR